mmetsp:Transcript_29132/g.45582  ORF Transcript_29132/g.45582 Transcript_29132/m.45582 type:complete len:350 (+) Transcript_29132:84-1133(+)
MELSYVLRLTYYAAGVVGTLLVYGLLQERIMTVPYDGIHLFKISAFLVFCNRVVNSAYAAVVIGLSGDRMRNEAPLWKYMVISFANVIATTCQYECLKYVSFPVQVLGKSFKMVPVMLWGVVLSGKQHRVMDWVVTAFVCLGVSEFLLTGNISAPLDRTGGSGNSVWGLLLLAAFLVFDGLASTSQEKLFKDYKTSKYNQILYVNLFSAIISLIVLGACGQIRYCIDFSLTHAEFSRDVFVLSGAAAASQYFIYSQVQEFGALVLAATMNLRQVISIVFSCLQYGHALSWLQLLGLCVVFLALDWKSYASLSAAKFWQVNNEGQALLASKDVHSHLPVGREDAESVQKV